MKNWHTVNEEIDSPCSAHSLTRHIRLEASRTVHACLPYSEAEVGTEGAEDDYAEDLKG